MELGTKEVKNLNGNGTTTIQATEWKKYGKHRVYFKKIGKGSSGQACWDVNANEWIKVHHEFGRAFCEQCIRRAFGF